MWFLIAALFSALLQLVFHLGVQMYWPHTGLIPRYVLGTIGLLLPPSLVLTACGHSQYVLMFWLCAGASGAAVWGGHRFGDWLTEYRNRVNQLERLEALLNVKADEAQRDD